ncbi:MAG: hypothetical protein NC548_33965 [Lachnospiraceae bacterium]|nr:hypothetical protein [Lachnospiraceae bacterium]
MATSNGNPVTQYVGPYMVPHGWTDWDSETQYQPLAVVKYNLAWYILKQPAPVGSVPTNEEYWAQVDNWQGQVELLSQEINTFNNALNENKAELEQSINTNSDKIQSNSNNININRHNILTPNKNKKYLFLSDSFGSTYTNVTTPFPAIVSNITQLDITSVSKIGGGFNTSVEKNWFINVMSEWIKNNKELSLDIDEMWIFSGTNELRDNLQINMNSFFNYIREHMPNCVITLCFCGCYLQTNANVLNMMVIKKLYREYASPNNVKYIDNLYTSILGNLNSDNVHPNQKGQNYLAWAVVQSLYGIKYINSTNYALPNFSNLNFKCDGENYCSIYGLLNFSDFQKANKSYNNKYTIIAWDMVQPFPNFNELEGVGFISTNDNAYIGKLLYSAGKLIITVYNYDLTNISNFSMDCYMSPYNIYN